MSPLKLRSRLHNILHRVKPTHTDTEPIALSFAIGTFIAIVPLFGLGIATAALIAVTNRNVNKIALFAPLVILNPIVLVPIYSFCFLLGNLIFGMMPNTPLVHTSLLSYSIRFMAGNLVIAVLLSFGSYFVMKQAVIQFHIHEEKMWKQKYNIPKFLRRFRKIH